MAFKSNMLFDVLGNILTTKSEELYEKHIKDENFKDAAKFMILRYLTMSSDYKVRQAVINNYITLERMPETILYKFLLKAVPKQSSSFIRYLR